MTLPLTAISTISEESSRCTGRAIPTHIPLKYFYRIFWPCLVGATKKHVFMMIANAWPAVSHTTRDLVRRIVAANAQLIWFTYQKEAYITSLTGPWKDAPDTAISLRC
jgi:hypothetical protein